MELIIWKIERFLRAFKIAEGGNWPEVTQEEIEALQDIISAIIEEKWQRYLDLGPAVDVTIIDRTRFSPRYFKPMPRGYMDEDSGYTEALQTALHNLRVASGDVQTILDLANMSERGVI